MQDALTLALDEAQKAGATRVHRICLKIGVLSGAVPDALQFAFEALAPGTAAEGGQLEIEQVPARFWCAGCAREFEAENLLGQCPVCQNLSGDLRGGREMQVASLEID